MATLIPVLLALHLLFALGWVGGMFFAHFVLRPSAMELEPALRLGLWLRVFARFFAWVWIFSVGLVITGHGLLGLGVAAGSHAVLAMATLGWVMLSVYAYLYFRPYGAMRAALATGDLPAAAAAQARIRRLVATNLSLGLLTSLLGAVGRYLG